MGPSSCVLCLEIQYFSLWGALALGSWDDTKATPTKEDGNKPMWPTSASHGTGLVLWTSKYWVKPDNGWSKELQTTCVWFKILQWKRLAIAFLGNTLTHHKAFIVHFQCPFFLKRGKLCPYSITWPYSINSSLGNWHLGVPAAECILALSSRNPGGAYLQM